MISPRFKSVQLVLACLAGLFLAACNIQHTPVNEAGGQTTSASPTAAPSVKTWNDISVSKPDDRITIHYYRVDANYAGVNLWTWDVNQKNTPKQNSILPLGRDDFGVVFQIDRAAYGESAKIGIIPRIGMDWQQKDGADKIWTPQIGNEVWLVSAKDLIFAQKPDVSPRVETAYVDAPDRIAVTLTVPAPASAQVFIVDQNDHEIPASAYPVGTAPASTILAVTPQQPIDFTNGSYSIRVVGFGNAVPLKLRGLLDNRDLYFDGDLPLGSVVTPESTTFRLFAPTATAVSAAFYDEATGTNGRAVVALNKGAKGMWDMTVKGDLRGKFYSYFLDGPGLNPANEILDPYAVNAVALSTRARISEMPVPPPPGPSVQSPTDMVIYEMHVRDFTIDPNSGAKNRGLYLGFTESNTCLPNDVQMSTTIDHLTELGVTHVQIMPVQDFTNSQTNGGYNWGYIPMSYFSPEGRYSTNPNDDSRMRELKALITALHQRGIGVIMDVVYNHTSTSAPFLSISPDYYYRHLPDGSLANGSACDNELRTEAPMVRRLVLDSLKYWVKQYGVDGFRFDLMALIDQDTMRKAEKELKAINPNIVLYGEPWKAGPSPLTNGTDKDALRKVDPIGAFNDDFRNALHGPPDGSEPGWIQNGSNRDALKAAMMVSDWFASPVQSINYMTCHDNLVLWDKLKISMPGAPDQLIKDTMKLGYLVLFTSQGVPLMQGGEEFGRTKGGDGNSYVSPDSVNEVDWSLKRKNYDLFTYTRDVIALRKAHPIFRLRTRDEVTKRLQFEDTPNDTSLMYTLDGTGVPGEPWRRACVVLNSDGSTDAQLSLPPGRWSVALDQGGAATSDAPVSGTVTVHPKSGLVLYQL